MYLKSHKQIREQIKDAKLTDLSIGLITSWVALEFTDSTVIHWIEVDTDSYSQMIEDLNLMEVEDLISHEIVDIEVMEAMNSNRNFIDCIKNKLPFNITKVSSDAVAFYIDKIQSLANIVVNRAIQEGVNDENDDELIRNIKLLKGSYE